MPGVSRVGIDIAGGLIIGVLAPRTIVNGVPVTVVGAAIVPHGLGPHGSPFMITGTSRWIANGIQVCRAGDLANCGHATSGGSRTLTAS